jgi:2-dehydropantoate 2-reductase
MKIAVVGCGALGSFYGAKLCRAGHEVHFLLRSDFEAVRQAASGSRARKAIFTFNHMLRARSAGNRSRRLGAHRPQDNREPCPPAIAASLDRPHTAILTLQNGLGNEAAVAAVAGGEKTMGGVCFVCLNRIAPGKIRHMAHGNIVLGEYGRPPQARTLEICQAFVGAGVPCKVAENIEQARWEKLVWNIPFNGLGVASVAGLDAVLQGRSRREPNCKVV